MLLECTFDDVPSWLLNELLQSCPNFKWSRNGLPLNKDTPRLTIKSGSERIKADPEDHDDQRYWEMKIHLVHAGVSVSKIEDKYNLFDDRKGHEPYCHDVYELHEPEIMAFYATLSLVGPRNVQDNSPTNYKTARLILGSPVHVSDRVVRDYEDLVKPDILDVYLVLRLYQRAIHDMPYTIDEPYGQNFDPSGLVPPPWESFPLWDDLLSEVTGLTVYKFTRTEYDSNGIPSTSYYEESNPWTSHNYVYDYNSLVEKYARNGGAGSLRYLFFDVEWELRDEFISLAENATTKADIALIRKLSSGPVNLGMMAAGMPQTARMLYGRVDQLVQALDALRRRDVKTLTKLLGQPDSRSKKKNLQSLKPEDLFLEYQFGWVQLYNDLNGILQALLESMYQDGQILHANAYASSDPDIDHLRVFSRKKNTPNPDFLIKEADKSIKIIRGNQAPVNAAVNDDDYRDKFELTIRPLSTFPMFATQHNSNWKVQDASLKTLQSLGITNPFVVAWDLVPYSFVVDWIISTDAIVKQISYDDGLAHLPSSTTIFEYWPKTVARGTSSDLWEGDIELVQAPCGWFITNRTPREFNLSVSLARAIKQAAAPFDIYQVATLTALLMQRIKG